MLTLRAYGKAIMFVRLPRCHSVNNLGLNTNELKLRSVAYTPRWTVENGAKADVSGACGEGEGGVAWCGFAVDTCVHGAHNTEHGQRAK